MAGRSLSLIVSVLALVEPASASAPATPLTTSEEWVVAQKALQSDAECGSAATADDGEECGLSMLQVRSHAQQQIEAEAKPCQGPWCATVNGFCHLFDSNNPRTMQNAVNQYAEYANPNEGIKIAVTSRDYYEMYHGNVASKLSEYLPQGLFSWKFENIFQTMEPTAGPLATVIRDGTITFKMGWWRRRMFWSAVVRHLGRGQPPFPFSQVDKFRDCDRCPAKMLFTLKKGGLRGGPDWKIIGLTLIKLA